MGGALLLGERDERKSPPSVKTIFLGEFTKEIFLEIWGGVPDSNRQHLPPQGSALPLS